LQALGAEQDDTTREASVVAGGLAKAAQILVGRYTLVTTNPPYLTRGGQDDVLKGYCELHFLLSKNDLATVFLERCLGLCTKGGTASLVLPQNWLFLDGYRRLREQLLTGDTWHVLVRLGPGAFETMSRGMPTANEMTAAIGQTSDIVMHGLDVSLLQTVAEKDLGLRSADVRHLRQKTQLGNPEAKITLELLQDSARLNDYAGFHNGICSGDYQRFGRRQWELPSAAPGWVFQQTTVETTQPYSGLTNRLHWEGGKGKLLSYVLERLDGNAAAWLRGTDIWGTHGVLVSAMSDLPVALYSGFAFDDNSVAITANDIAVLPAIWAFCSSAIYHTEVRKLNQSLKVRGPLVEVPFDLDYWTEVAQEKFPYGLPKPHSDDPTQWVFHGHPCRSIVWSDPTRQLTEGPLRIDATVLQVAVARLVGYRWPAELDAGLELSEESRAVVNACDSLLPFADKDGIVCIPPVRGEPAAADRLLDLLAAAYGKAWNTDVLSQLLAQCDSAGIKLETWLRDKFFAQHCKLFQHRPFVWHIWDGLPDGFAALVDYHRLDHKNLETLIYTYLGAWIARQRQDIASGVDGAVERLAAAQRLQKDLEQILLGEDPYDIFVRWKPLSQQPLGWDPDLNDGVRLNIRPFVTAHVLRNDKKPQLNISWDKDGQGCGVCSLVQGVCR
jgi:hypothetical protein